MSDYFVHPHGICESEKIGRGTRIWAFAHVLPGAQIGTDCNVCDHVFIENDVRVGDRVTIKPGVQLWDGVELEDDVFVGPNVTFTNDPFPRSRVYPTEFSRTVVRRGASIGANATILPGIVIGPGAMIGAGSVVTKDVPANAIVKGNPARISSYVPTHSKVGRDAEEVGAAAVRRTFEVAGVKLVDVPTHGDMRGDLMVADFEKTLPFNPRRFFMVYNVPSEGVRGEHAHRACHQFLICLQGRVRVLVDDGRAREELVLDRPTLGLHMPPMIWGTQYGYSEDAVLGVFASMPYEAEDYIRDYDTFVRDVARRE